MDPDFLHAINGDWDALLGAMRESRSLVHRTDSSGMSILHWVCLHQDVSSDVVIKVVFANPHAVHLRNDAGHLPIDLALQAECGERILEILRAAGNAQDVRAAEHPELHRDVSYGHSASNDYEPSSPQQFQPQHQPQASQQQYHHNHPHHQQQYQHQEQYHHPHQHHQEQYQYQQQQPNGRMYQQQRSDSYSHDEEPQQQQLVMHGGLQQQQHQQQHQQRGRENSYRRYPEDDDSDNESRYMVHAPGSRPRRSSAPKPQQSSAEPKGLISIYANRTGAERSERERQRSLSSHNNNDDGFSALMLTEQRLQQREHDLISYATEHDDLFDPAAADMTTLLRPPMAAGGSSAGNGGGWSKEMGDSGKKPRAQSSFPPRWKQSRSCHVCVTQFTLMKRRHHCRNCGQSVCGAHSTNRVALPKFGLLDPQRLCDKCFLMGTFLPPSSASVGALPAGSGSFGVDSLGSVPSSRHHRDYRSPSPYQQPQAAYAGR